MDPALLTGITDTRTGRRIDIAYSTQNDLKLVFGHLVFANFHSLNKGWPLIMRIQINMERFDMNSRFWACLCRFVHVLSYQT